MGGSPVGEVSIQYAVSIFSVNWRNGNRTLCYDGLENISLRSKDFNGKNIAKQIQLKLCFYGCILGKYSL